MLRSLPILAYCVMFGVNSSTKLEKPVLVAFSIVRPPMEDNDKPPGAGGPLMAVSLPWDQWFCPLVVWLIVPVQYPLRPHVLQPSRIHPWHARSARSFHSVRHIRMITKFCKSLIFYV